MNAPRVPLFDINSENAALRTELVDALTQVVDSGRYLHGPDVAALEAEMADFCEVPAAIGCASGSDALLLSLMALDIGPGDEVIVPSFTFFATASCVARVGARIVFADIDPRTYQIDPDSVAELIGPDTKAVIPVHLFGAPAPMDELARITSELDIALIEDAAQAVGATSRGRKVGSIGKVGCFSFYPTKNLGGLGDGGMLTTTDEGLADRLRLFAAHGMRPRYYHRVIGVNSRLDSLQAAALRVKLRQLARWNAARAVRAERYGQWLGQLGLQDHLALPLVESGDQSVWNQYTVRVQNGRRDALREHLSQRGIATEIYYPVPLHEQACFRGGNVRQGDLTATETAAREVLSLPVFPTLTEEQQRLVVDSIDTFYSGAVRRLETGYHEAERRESA